MAKRSDENDESVQFGALSLASSARAKPGPTPRDDSQRALIASGQAKWLKSAIPAELHKQLQVEAILRDTTTSELVAEALEAFFASESTHEPAEPRTASSERAHGPTKRITHASVPEPSGWGGEDEGVDH